MEIQVVPAEIREHRNFKLQSRNALHLDRVGRNLHHCVLPAGIDDLPEQFLQIRRFRRRALRGEIETRPAIFDSSENRGPFAGGL